MFYKYVHEYRHLPPGTICVRTLRSSQRTNNCKTVNIPGCKLERTNLSVYYQCARLWNVLSNDEINYSCNIFRTFIRSDVFYNRLLASNHTQPPLVVTIDI